MSWEGELSDTEMSIVTGENHMRDDIMGEVQTSPQLMPKTEIVRIHYLNSPFFFFN